MSEEKEKETKTMKKSDLTLHVVDRDEFCAVTETDEKSEGKPIGKIKPKLLSQAMISLLQQTLQKTEQNTLVFVYKLSNCMEVYLGVDCRDFFEERKQIGRKKDLYQMRYELLYKPEFDKIAAHTKEWHETGRTTPFKVDFSKVNQERFEIEDEIDDLCDKARKRLRKTLWEKYGMSEEEFDKLLIGGKL